jgi:hypothetical protein
MFLIKMFHVTPGIMAIFNNQCWWRCGETGTLVHCWWECNSVQPLWKVMEISLKAKDITAIWSSDSAPRHLPKKNVSQETIEVYRIHLFSDVHHNSFPMRQVMETTKVSYNWCMGQENVVYIHNGVLFIHKE